MKSIGILGGGQLSKLLVFKAKTLDIRAFVLSLTEQDPAALDNPFWIKGSPDKQKDLKAFFKLIDIITFESEFFYAGNIQKTLQGLKGKKLYAAPSLKALSLIQDRWTQKKLLFQHNIKTADFLKADIKKASQKKLLQLWEKLGPFVLKTRRGGYDGYGTFTIKRKSQIKNINIPSGSFIAEKFILFKRELAFLSARNKKGQIVFFPLVESFQKNSRCLWVKGPVNHKKIKVLKRQIKKLLNAIDYQGLIAFELFDTGKNLIVNELAPRVHNTGHYSLDSLNEDQFTVHLKAIMNCPLKNPRIKTKAFAMLNLLGEGTKKPALKTNKKSYLYLKENLKLGLTINKGIKLWWYGKAISRKGRKMGHINATGSSAEQALRKLLKIRKCFKV